MIAIAVNDLVRRTVMKTVINIIREIEVFLVVVISTVTSTMEEMTINIMQIVDQISGMEIWISIGMETVTIDIIIMGIIMREITKE